MTVIKVKCSPEHARRLAGRAQAFGEFEMAAALTVLADDFEQLRLALVDARPFVYGRVLPPGHPERDWRAENAEAVLALVDAALERTDA